MKRKYYVLGSASIIMLIIIAFTIFLNHDRLNEELTLKENIIKTIENSQEIDFTKVASFDWDKMYILGPYANPKLIFKENKIDIANGSYNITVLDNIYMLAFVKDNKVVAYINLPRSYIKNDITVLKLDRQEAIFKVSIYDKSIIFSPIQKYTSEPQIYLLYLSLADYNHIYLTDK